MEKQNKNATTWPQAITTLGLFALIGFALWLTGNIAVLVGLIGIIATLKINISEEADPINLIFQNDPTKCPKCGHEFSPVAKNE